MVQPANPFAAPNTDSLPTTSRGFALEGDTLIMPKTSSLPPLCVRCGAPTNYRLQQTLYWHHPAVYLALLFNLIIYLIVALAVRKTATIGVPICDEHKESRSRALMIGLAVMLLGMGGCIGSLAAETPAFAVLTGFGFPVAGLVILVVGRRTVSLKKIDKDYIYLVRLPQAIISRVMAR